MWSFSPISGAGAAKTGGRFNRKGEPTLYLSLDIMTAVGECTQGLTQRLLPLTMCEYDVDCDPVADLRTDAGRKALNVELGDLACAWLDYLRAGEEAPSWKVVDRLKADLYAGMLIPSFAVGATDANCNLILWRWGQDLPTRVGFRSKRTPAEESAFLELIGKSAKPCRVSVLRRDETFVISQMGTPVSPLLQACGRGNSCLGFPALRQQKMSLLWAEERQHPAAARFRHFDSLSPTHPGSRP